MHPSLSTALASLDEYIKYLTEIRAQLAQGGRQGFSAPEPTSRRLPPRKRLRPRKGGSGRKNEVAQFIKTHGPSKRSAIKEGTKIPVGTLAYALNDKTLFKRLPDGSWDLAA